MGYRMGAEVTMFGPSRRARPWVVSGLIVQAVGAGAAAVVLWRDIRKEGLGGHITAEMIRFAWRSELHTRAGLIVLAAGAVLYAAGSVLMARPYISRPAMLFIAVPVAAVAGLLVLGVLALAAAVVVWALTDLNGWDFPIPTEGGGGKDRRRGSRERWFGRGRR